MEIIGEKINTSRKSVAAAVENRDAGAVAALAREQADAGAQYIDVNAGTFVEKEIEYLPWLVETVQAAVKLPLCLDSPSPAALEKAMARHQGEPLVNSISLEAERYDQMLPLVLSRPCKIVALCMARTSMPVTAQERLDVASELIEKLTGEGVALENIYVDPLIQPVSVDGRMGKAALEAISGVMKAFPGVNTICGLSNISFGLPMRKRINRDFFTMAMGRGLSAAILDPTDGPIMARLIVARMLMGDDEYCSDYIDAYQDGILKDN